MCFVLFFLSVIQILNDVYISWIENVQYLNECHYRLSDIVKLINIINIMEIFPKWIAKTQPTNQVKMRHGLMLLWFTDLMNVTEEVTIHRPNVSTLLSSAFIRGDLNTATRGPFI